MQLTVQDVLDYELLDGAIVCTAKDYAKSRPVHWVSVMEMPVENFVRRNELVLTTAMGCKNDLETFRGFVKDIIDSGAAALMIAMGRHVYEIPKEIMALAKEHDFLIVELPWELRFSTIIEEVMINLNDLHQQERQRSEQVQQDLLKLILADAELGKIAAYIRRELGSALLITDSHGVIQAGAGFSHAKIGAWEELVEAGTFPIREASSKSNRDPMVQKFRTGEMAGRKLVQVPVLRVSEEPQGYLFVELPEASAKERLDVFMVHVLEHASTTISLWLSRQNAVEETKAALRMDFVRELAHGEFSSKEQAASRARALGYDLDLAYVSLAGYPENFRELFEKRAPGDNSYTDWSKSMIAYIEEEIYYAAHAMKRTIMMSFANGRLIIFLEKPPESEQENQINFLDLIERRLGNLLPEVVISWGIGDFSEGFEGFNESFQHALTALEIGRMKKGAGHRTDYRDTSADRLLLQLAKTEGMKDVILSTIQPLVDYDRQRQMDLIGTFSAYNHYQGNVSQTARALNLHRQSLLYRLRKIEALTGLSLVDPDDLFLLELCVRTYRIHATEENEL
ncbi:PucR family transcriptional regulator [Planococcus sp. ISL-109]|uniref:PucR family transcriptional regulator n=1 Tax=Planococcus sp. ISL-109 TaxID=2819166 RepID=UPI001BE4E727|nr:PucR family transcriptional regulator [Planococcus sp. ISL-109]MBT2583377.1 PucR family transcriptional regulator ligand-binding domain-containing protein [Planococcus sp. ISL-109]